MVWRKDKHGLATWERLTAAEIDALGEAGKRVYATLAGLVASEGVQATSFSSFAATPVYDGVRCLELGDIARLEPVGVVADYKVDCLGGRLVHPPRHAETVRQAYWAEELIRTGERRYHLAVLDTEELTLFFKGETPSAAVSSAAAAMRKLYPGTSSLYAALEEIPGLSLHEGPVMGAPDDKVAGCVRAADGAVTFFLESDEDELRARIGAHYGAAHGDDVFELAETAGDRIDIGFMWLNDLLVDQAIAMREDRDASTDFGM